MVAWIDSLGVLVNALGLVRVAELEICETLELGCCDMAELGTCARLDEPTMCGATVWMLCIVWNGNCVLFELSVVGVRPAAAAAVARAFAGRLRP